jgi:hypothetical protein
MTRRLLVASAALVAAVGIVQLAANVEDEGKVLAGRYCASCHLMPLPEHLDRSTWLTKVFPMMREYLGLDPKADRELLPHDLKSMYPSVPSMTEDEWFKIANWYVDHAPDTLPPAPEPAIEGLTPLFTPLRITSDDVNPMTIMVRFDTASRRIITADALLGTMSIYSATGSLQKTIDVGGPVSSVVVRGATWFVTDMGKLLPHDSAAGGVVSITWNGDQYTKKRIIDSLRRPTHISVDDLNGDGRDDLLVCEYGNLLGRLGWFEQTARRWKYHELVPLPGAIRTEIRDINGDGRKDIIALMAQAREGLFVHINRGKGRFEIQELLTFPPSYGSSSFGFADINADGRDELLVTTGDNGDYLMPPYKPYHGVYVCTLDKSGRVTQKELRRLDGAYGAMVRDFDLDGTQDLLAYSYFPRLERGSHDFIRLETSAFTPRMKTWTLPMADQGRWLPSDLADIDADGDFDVILGNVSIGPGRVTDEQSAGWREGRLRALILVNTTRN